MLTLLSPAKSLDFESRPATAKASEPRWSADSAMLVDAMMDKRPQDLEAMMGISHDLALVNHERFQEWSIEPDRSQVRQAVLAFNGDAYRGLDARSLSERDFTHAQKHLRILSGLYGILRPLDLIQPYRLEMGSKLANARGNDLYDFWSKTVTESLNEDLDGRRSRVIVNLASQEYSKVVDRDLLDASVISPSFLDLREGGYRVISFFAKRARGLMARWLIRGRVASVRAVQTFAEEGYRYDRARSDRLHPVFIRDGR
jgi:cytoplasmic iron level regulating protein YaaA (DUF328/UPF0246 family)